MTDRSRVTVEWTRHALARMDAENIDFDETRETVLSGEVIMEYPNDRPYPSMLLLGLPAGRPVHVVVARPEHDTVRVITAYRPDPGRWDASYRRRR